MEHEVLRQMYRIVDEHVGARDLHALLKAFIRDKEQEQSHWSEITRYAHCMLGGASPHIERIAAATELIILSLDIIDDLQDRDNESKPWMRCPQEYALNAVLALIAGFMGELGLILGNGRQEQVTAEVSQILFRSINGQQKDLNRSVRTIDDYLLMVQEKSGSLFRLACYMGYASLSCSSETIRHVNDLADCIGLIHQIQNDMKDIVCFDLKSDLLSRKRTLPVLYLLSVDDESFSGLRDYYDGLITQDDLLKQKQKLLHDIDDSGCVEYARVVQSVCIHKANELFGKIPAVSPWKEKFKEITYGVYEEYLA